MRAHMVCSHLSVFIGFYCREGCIDGRGASFAVSAEEVLKASGPPGMGHVTVSHPRDLWTCHDKHPRAAVVALGVGRVGI